MKVFRTLQQFLEHYLPVSTEKEALKNLSPKELGEKWAKEIVEKVRRENDSGTDT